MIGMNSGHGHVWERPDGVKARCGGPGICTQCSLDLARMSNNEPPAPAPVVSSPNERAAFEKWAEPEMFDLLRHQADSETYRNVLTRNAWDAWRARAAQVETSRDAPLIKEIFERHDRVSKLLWGPGAAPGTMLGPMDADAAHSDRGTLLSLIPGSPLKTNCSVSEIEDHK